MTEWIVDARALERSFGKLVAVRNVSLQIAKGEVFGVLGPNGAGKSTTIRMLCGILDPSGGSAQVVGFDVARDPDAVKARIGYMTQRFSLYEDLTVEENLRFYAGIYGVPRARRRARIDEMLTLNRLVERRKQIAGTLSGGWKQRVALACATVHAPPLLFLDEPTAGVDPVSRRDFWEEIHRLAAEGTTVLVTTHYMDEAERCHRLAFIFRGTLLDVGTPDEIVERRGLGVLEIDVDQPRRALTALASLESVEDVSSLGSVLRVTFHGAHGDADIDAALASTGIAVRSRRRTRASVEDAFVSMVRDDERVRRAS